MSNDANFLLFFEEESDSDQQEVIGKEKELPQSDKENEQ